MRALRNWETAWNWVASMETGVLVPKEPESFGSRLTGDVRPDAGLSVATVSWSWKESTVTPEGGVSVALRETGVSSAGQLAVQVVGELPLPQPVRMGMAKAERESRARILRMYAPYAAA